MAKRHSERPALNAADVWRWLISVRIPLEIVPIKGTPAMIVAKGKNVRQAWVRRRGTQITKQTGVTYLGLGIILVPRWIPVSDWRADYLRTLGIADRKHGFAAFEGTLCELCYQQVEDLDHARRQQEYILKGYELPQRKLVEADFETMMVALERMANITRHISGRKAGTDSLFTLITNRLASMRRSLSSFLANAPTLNGDSDPKKADVLVAAIGKMAAECRGIACRPLVMRLRRASRSMGLAIEHIGASRYNLARERISAALNNLEYPTSNAKADPPS